MEKKKKKKKENWHLTHPLGRQLQRQSLNLPPPPPPPPSSLPLLPLPLLGRTSSGGTRTATWPEEGDGGPAWNPGWHVRAAPSSSSSSSCPPPWACPAPSGPRRWCSGSGSRSGRTGSGSAELRERERERERKKKSRVKVAKTFGRNRPTKKVAKNIRKKPTDYSGSLKGCKHFIKWETKLLRRTGVPDLFFP